MDTNDDLRVKYYSTNDLSAGFYLKRIEDIICNFVVEKKRVDINEIIELYNIQQFFHNRIYLPQTSFLISKNLSGQLVMPISI